MQIISTLCAIIVGIAMFVTPILLLIFLIRWAMKKSKKKIGIATLIGVGCFIGFTILGVATDPSTYCEHEYHLVENHPATCEEPGYEMYHCDLCDNDSKVKLDKLGHDMVEVSRTEAAPGVDGEIVYQCTRCEKQDVEVLEKLPEPTETTASTETTPHIENTESSETTVVPSDPTSEPTQSKSAAEKFATQYDVTIEFAESLEIALKGTKYSLNQMYNFEPIDDWAYGKRYKVWVDMEYIWYIYEENGVVVSIRDSHMDFIYNSDK